MSALSERPDDAVVGQALPHESAALHVTGAGALHRRPGRPDPATCLHAYPVQAPHAHARVTGLRPDAGATTSPAWSGC